MSTHRNWTLATFEAKHYERACDCAHTRAEHVYAIAECRMCDCQLWRPERELERDPCLCSHDRVLHNTHDATLPACGIVVCGCRSFRPKAGAA